MPEGKNKLELSIGENDTIKDCIAAIGLPLNDEYTALVNADFKPMDYCPKENDIISIVYLVLGG